MADYDVLLLDFGGVCLLNPIELHHRAERLFGLPQSSLQWLGPLDPATDELWRRMIAGDGITERDYWALRSEEIGRAAGIELDLPGYMRALYDPPTPELIRPHAIAVVDAARAAGFGVSVLTNDMRDFHGRQWEQQIPFLQSVDHIVDCSDTKILKPDPRAFDLARTTVDAPAERILFVDDQPRNVNGANDVGMDGMWFDIANAASSWLTVADRLGLDVALDIS